MGSATELLVKHLRCTLGQKSAGDNCPGGEGGERRSYTKDVQAGRPEGRLGKNVTDTSGGWLAIPDGSYESLAGRFGDSGIGQEDLVNYGERKGEAEGGDGPCAPDTDGQEFMFRCHREEA